MITIYLVSVLISILVFLALLKITTDLMLPVIIFWGHNFWTALIALALSMADVVLAYLTYDVWVRMLVQVSDVSPI